MVGKPKVKKLKKVSLHEQFAKEKLNLQAKSILDTAWLIYQEMKNV